MDEPKGAEQLARRLLEAKGYVVLKRESYRRAQERQRLAEARARWADEERESNLRWMRSEVFPEERRLRDRCSRLYGLAARYGATDDELRG